MRRARAKWGHRSISGRFGRLAGGRAGIHRAARVRLARCAGRFESGNFDLTGTVSAVALKAGASGQVKFDNGVAVFDLAQGRLDRRSYGGGAEIQLRAGTIAARLNQPRIRASPKPRMYMRGSEAMTLEGSTLRITLDQRALSFGSLMRWGGAVGGGADRAAGERRRRAGNAFHSPFTA